MVEFAGIGDAIISDATVINPENAVNDAGNLFGLQQPETATSEAGLTDTLIDAQVRFCIRTL